MRHLWIAFISSLITQVAAAAPSLSHQSLAFQSDAAGTIETAFRFQVARDVPVIGFPGPQELFLPAPTLASALNGPLVLDIQSNTLSALVVNEGRRVLATGSQFSANGRYQLVVALGPVHPNGSGERDGTYLVDRQTGAYRLVNHLPGQPEVIADGFITGEHVSDDGEVVYFSYEGIDLAPTQVDRMQRLVYGFERASGTIRLINPAPLGTATDQAFSVFWVSANGREVIYGGGESLFHYDWQTNQSRAITGMPLGSGGRLISRSGQFLFSCATVRRPGATQTDSIWTRRDLLTGDALVLNPVSNAAASTDTCLSVGEASDDGSVFAFSSAMPPISGIPDPSNWQTYRWSAATGQTELISHAFGQSDAFALGASIHSDLSADGRTLLFRSTAQNLVPGITGGRVNALYRYDAQRQSMQLVSATQSAPTVPLESGVAALLSDGSAVFASRAELDETVRDWNLSGDLFRRTETGTATLLSRTIVTAPISASRGVARHALSADGRWLAMQSTARSLVPGGLDLNQQPDVLLVDTWTGQRRVISNSADRLAQTARGTSELITISADGQTVLFQSNASDLNADLQSDGLVMHTFVFQQGQIRAVNRRPQSQGGGFGDAATPLAISADGSQVLVLSRYPETLLERYQANPAEGAAQLLLLNTRGANSRLVSRSATSAENGADQEVHFVAASKSMRYVLFSSAAQNLEGAAWRQCRCLLSSRYQNWLSPSSGPGWSVAIVQQYRLRFASRILLRR